MRAYIVIDLGFGDAGKGLLTDFLGRHFQAGLVVRYNGGAQAGHLVTLPDGRAHSFSQFGAATFLPGVKTYLSKFMVVHPGALLVEGDLLSQKGVPDAFSRLRISDQVLLITPFHQAANRLREIARGDDRHGSCGVGVGEAVEHAQSHPEDRILAGDLRDPARLRRKALRLRDQVRSQLAALPRVMLQSPAARKEWEVFNQNALVDDWIASIARIDQLSLVVSDDLLRDWLQHNEVVIFEGAQGMLLDASAGFHPYTTWSDCTAANALTLLAELAPGAATCKIGIMRSHAVRHGPGPLPTETKDLDELVSDHNQANPWQGPVRYGWFDAVLLRYALAAAGGVDALAVTHLDLLRRLEAWYYCDGYMGSLNFTCPEIRFTTSAGILTDLHIARSASLQLREELTRSLFQAEPVLSSCGPKEEDVLNIIGTLLGQPVKLTAHGPTAEDMEVRIDL